MRTCKKGHKYKLEHDEKGRLKYCPECQKIRYKAFHERRKQAAGYLKYHKEVQAKWYKKHGNNEYNKLMRRAYALRTRYWPHLTAPAALQEYERILAEQNYCCMICEVHEEEYDSSFHVDHCHKTGKVRGLLCAVCNRYVVGGIDIRAKAKKVYISKPQLIKNIIKYFEEHDPEYMAFIEKMKLKPNG